MLRLRTGYSFRAAAGMLPDAIARLQAIGAAYAPISDRASTFAWNRWSKLAHGVGLRPVLGVELAVTASIHAKKPSVDYWTFWAIDDIKWINRLVQKASEQFRYEPLLTEEQAMAAEGVFRVIGHRSDVAALTPDDRLYAHLAPSVSKGYFNAATRAGHKWLASSDNKFLTRGDAGFYEIVCGRNASLQTYDQFLQSEEEWSASVAHVASPDAITSALAASAMVAATCTARLRKATLLSPPKPATLLSMCVAGAEKLGVNLESPEYGERLTHELALIAEKNFEDYFYIVSDMMQWARKRMVCGPARGSSCGSLVCYLLEITTIEPMKFGLLFERFIDVTRADLPDIDVDFSDQKRHMVFEYMEQKYGRERIARLGTVALFRPASSLNEAGAALKVPKWLCDAVIDKIIVRSSAESRANNTLEDSLNETTTGIDLKTKYPEITIASRMEAHPRHHGSHAAGIVLTADPVMDYVAIDARTGATHCDKKDAEDLNLLKIDALGLTQLSVFEDALTMAGLPIDYLESVDLEDQEAFAFFNEQKFCGIFQFNGNSLQNICKGMKVESLNDIVSITALGRPGPIMGGGTGMWMQRRTGKSSVTYLHPLLKPYLESTFGVVVYQEQILLICREIGGMDWKEVTALRKAMSKSMGKEFFDSFGERFYAGATARGIEIETAKRIWNELCTFGAYGFNKAHSVAYGMVSYWCAWMKAHHPFEFAAASLSHESDPGRQLNMLREMASEGIDYIPADINLSMDKWSAGWKDGRKVLVGPVQNVKGVGPKLASQIMSARARGEPMPARAEKLLTSPVTSLDELFPIKAAFRRLLPNPAERNIMTPPTRVIDIQCKSEEHQILAFVILERLNVRDENEFIHVEKRGGKRVSGPATSLIMMAADDTDKIYTKINRFKFESIGKPIIERGGAGRALYAVKGRVPKSFRMIDVDAVRFIGFIEDKAEENIQEA